RVRFDDEISDAAIVAAAGAADEDCDWVRCAQISNPRHCEPTGRRKAPPVDRLRAAIQSQQTRLDCFVADAPRNDENARCGQESFTAPRRSPSRCAHGWRRT